MDELPAEVFVQQPSSGSFKGDPQGRFQVVIESTEYGPNKTSGSFGLYGGSYMIVF